MLRLVVFLGGAILMALEIVGSRVLSPYFGSSIFVWGSLISIFLTALSVGYYWGGRLADRRPNLKVLGALVAIPGALIWLLPFYFPIVNEWVAAMDLGPRFSPLLTSTLLFAVPSIFLGTISPYAIRLEIQSVETAGNTAGSLYALSTAGSIVGTLAASFFLIPMMGVRNILHTLGLLLLIIAAGSLLMGVRQGTKRPHTKEFGATSNKSRTQRTQPRQRGRANTLVLLLAVGLVLLGALTPWEGESSEFVYTKESLYHHIKVRDAGRLRILHFDNSFQSAINLDDPDEQVFMYTRYLHLGRLFAPDAQNSIFVGLGAGSAPRRFHRDYPEMTIDVVEIDPEVVAVAERYFGLETDERLRVWARDGRLFTKQTDARYDLAVLDAYFAESIPFHLTTVEFLREVQSRLTADGVVVANVIGAVSGPQSRLFRSMLATYDEVFPQVYVFLVGASGKLPNDTVRNIIVIATQGGERLSREQIAALAEQSLQSGAMSIDVRPFVDSLVGEPIPTADVPVLTDDYAPVDALQHF